MAPIDRVPEEDRFLEHRFGVPAHITRRTHEYKLGTVELSPDFDRDFWSADPEWYDWIVPRGTQRLAGPTTQSFVSATAAQQPDPLLATQLNLPKEPLSEPNHRNTRKNARQRASRKARKNASKEKPDHLQYEEELDDAGPSESMAAAQLSVPELAPSASDDDVPSPPPKTPENSHENPSRLDASDVGERPLPESTPSVVGKASASLPLGSLGDVVQSGFKLDAPVVAQPSSPEPAPLTSHSAAASPQRQLGESAASHVKSDASAITRPYLPEITSPKPATEPLPTLLEEGGFTTVTWPYKPNLIIPVKIKGHINTYQTQQRSFEIALLKTPVLAGESDRLKGLFEWDADGHLSKLETVRFKSAAEIARGSPAWTPESSRKMMHALWWTIFHREAAGAWYACLHVKNKRVEDDVSHRHFIVVLKTAWRILDDGVEYDPGCPPTAE